MKYLAAILFGCCLVLSGSLWYSGKRLDAAKDAAEQARFDLVGANATIKLQADTLVRWQRAAEVQAAALDQARANEAVARQAAAALKQKVKDLENSDANRPDCQALLSTDLGVLCPGHADAYRLHASGVP